MIKVHHTTRIQGKKQPNNSFIYNNTEGGGSAFNILT